MTESSDGKRGKLKGMLADSFYMAFGTYATHLFSLLINLLLVRKLSLENFGVYSVMLSAYSMGTLVFSFGINAIIQRYLPELLAKHNKRGVNRLQSIAIWTHLGGGLLIALLSWIFRGQLSVWLKTPDFAGLLPYFILFTLFKFEASILEEMLTAHRRQKFRNLVLAAFQALKFCLFLFALPQDGSVQTVMLFLGLSNLLLFGTFLCRVLGISKRIPDDNDEDLPWRRMIRFGLLRYTTTVTLVGFFTDIDVWFITHFHGPAQAGLYGFATKTVHMLATLVPTQYLISVLLPVYIKEYTLNKDPKPLIKVFSFYNKLVTAFLAPTLIGSLLLTTPIIAEVFDPKYLPSVLSFRLFFIGMFVFFVCNTSSFLLVVLERPEITLYSRVFIIYNIIMDLILIPRIGIAGAAIATGSAMALGYIFTYLMVKRIIKVRMPWAAFVRTFFYCGVMALAVWPLLGWIDSILKLLVAVLVGAVIYGLMAWRLPVFNSEERDRINTAFGKRVFPV